MLGLCTSPGLAALSRFGGGIVGSEGCMPDQELPMWTIRSGASKRRAAKV